MPKRPPPEYTQPKPPPDSLGRIGGRAFHAMTDQELQAYWELLAKIYEPAREEMELAINHAVMIGKTQFAPMSACIPTALCVLIRTAAEGAGIEWSKRRGLMK